MDYLDLLLMRETRTAPLAEPRIDPGPTVALPDPSAWGEIVEERDMPYFPPPAAGRRRDEEPRRAEARAQVPVNEAVFPPSLDRPGDRAAVAGRPSPPAIVPVRFAAGDATQEGAVTPRPSQTREIVSAPPATAAVRTAPDAGPAHAGPRAPQPERRPPDEPRVIATRPAPVAPPTLAAEPAAAPPVTIRIDRVEVTATAAARPPAPASPRPRPRVSLDEFLKRRSGARHE